MSLWPGVIERYRQFLPVTSSTPIVTLHAGLSFASAWQEVITHASVAR